MVTGEGRGIGRSIARALAYEGADIAIIGRNSETLSDTESIIQAESVSDMVAVAGHVTRLEVVQAFNEAVRRDLRQVNILVNNAVGWSSEFFFEMDKDGAYWRKNKIESQGNLAWEIQR